MLLLSRDTCQFVERNDIISNNEVSRVGERNAVDPRSRFRLRISPTVADSISARSDMPV